ncbi:hypothetical protein DPMN_056532 [Dreissena polymorpha]|uniref:Uncharacterized protein n=1 Tax=Dreissena polymorpha TaxID=45954 RepID=A0A9D4HRL3_DREPO|nr:hypothetical protein DPMN_056532 [Dreissena polymorpha]
MIVYLANFKINSTLTLASISDLEKLPDICKFSVYVTTGECTTDNLCIVHITVILSVVTYNVMLVNEFSGSRINTICY